MPAKVVQITGPVSYIVEMLDGRTARRHVDQMRIRHVRDESYGESQKDKHLDRFVSLPANGMSEPVSSGLAAPNEFVRVGASVEQNNNEEHGTGGERAGEFHNGGHNLGPQNGVNYPATSGGGGKCAIDSPVTSAGSPGRATEPQVVRRSGRAVVRPTYLGDYV